MIRAASLAVSRPMYAFNPDTWRTYGAAFTVDAVWFKRKNGVLSAVMGEYHPLVIPFAARPADGTYESWITAANDNRYGGRWAAKWDGAGLLVSDTPVTPERTRELVDFLDPILKNFPDVPPSHDGWFTFPKAST